MYAAIGTDGWQPVVWGIGDTAEAAEAEASEELLESCGHQCSPGELRTVEIDKERAARVQAGDVDAEDLWAKAL